MSDTQKLSIPGIAIVKWRSIANILAQLAGMPAGIYVVDEDDIRVIGTSQGPAKPFAQSDLLKIKPGIRAYSAEVIRSREKLIVTDAAKNPAWKNRAGAKAGYVAYAGVPVFRPDGEVFGSICLFGRKPNRFDGVVVSLMEEFSELITGHLALIAKNTQLEETLKEVRTLQGLIPICAQCKKIRDDKGFWQKVEVYLEERSDVRFTHGLCDDCMRKLYTKEELPERK
ncbi:MAG: GAF domain-containing protein [Elusimicrobiota bacterium]